MTFQIADRVQETTTTTGTASLSLLGAVVNFQAFGSVMSDQDTTVYACLDNVNNAWEVGRGTYNSSGNTLGRTTPLASSNGGALVNFAAGTKYVFMDIAAAFVQMGPGQLRLLGATANASIGSLPPNAIITGILLRETAGHNVTVSVGSTSGGSNILASGAVPASGTLSVPMSALAANWFSASSAQTVFIASASWGSAAVNIAVLYQIGP
jgi:hypothetical protein